jgi:hypothetical protein
MKERISQLLKNSPAFAALCVSFALAFLFQAMRLFAGHNGGYTVKLVKIFTALLFIGWAFSYLKKQKTLR